MISYALTSVGIGVVEQVSEAVISGRSAFISIVQTIFILYYVLFKSHVSTRTQTHKVLLITKVHEGKNKDLILNTFTYSSTNDGKVRNVICYMLDDLNNNNNNSSTSNVIKVDRDRVVDIFFSFVGLNKTFTQKKRYSVYLCFVLFIRNNNRFSISSFPL